MKGEAGFTLIEILVALAVFSLAAIAMLNLQGESVRTAATLEERTLADIVVENRTVELMIDEAFRVRMEMKGSEQLGGRTFAWTRKVEETPDPDVFRIDVTVSDENGRTLATRSAFRSGEG